MAQTSLHKLYSKPASNTREEGSYITQEPGGYPRRRSTDVVNNDVYQLVGARTQARLLVEERHKKPLTAPKSTVNGMISAYQMTLKIQAKWSNPTSSTIKTI